MGRAFSEVFDARRNGLNFVRLSLATLVILYHSFPLTGTPIGFEPLARLLGNAWVDGFFAISGYLIVSSWANRPDALTFLRARCLRILPAFWVCLLVTAFVIVPVVTGVLGPDNWSYVYRNAALYINQYAIGGTPSGVPYPDAWNGSLWTLAWEFMCYLGVLALGVVGLLRRRWTIPIVFLGFLALSLLVAAGVTDNFWLVRGARFGLMFFAGALIWQFRDRVPVHGTVIATSAVVLAGSFLLPDYRLVGALPLAYLLLVGGAFLTSPRLALKNDISYGVYIYAFVVQQVLALWGVWQWGWAPFFAVSTAATIPLAAASWFLIEKPALRWKKRPPRKAAQPSVPAAT